MKTTTLTFFLILSLSMSVFAQNPFKNDSLLGKWKLFKAETNGLPNPASQMDRTFEYYKDDSFKGLTYNNGKANNPHRGKYYLPDDTTMICINLTPENVAVGLAATYHFHVANDTFNLYGVWYNGIQGRPELLKVSYINEWWVRMK